jgi:LPS export ABC transporter permease LptG
MVNTGQRSSRSSPAIPQIHSNATLPLVRILQRYLLARFLRLFTAILIGSTLAIVMVEMLLNFDNMLKTEEGISGVARYLFLRIPAYYMRDLIPIAAFGATFSALAIASRWFETTAIKAAGISPQRLMLPILLSGALLAVVSFVLSETAVLRATREWHRRSLPSHDAITSHWGSFWYHRGHTMYNITEAIRAEQALRGVRIWELDERGHLLRSVQAAGVTIQENGDWLFEDARIHRFDPKHPAAPPIFDRIPGQGVIELADTAAVALAKADTATLPIYELLQYVRARRQDGDPAPHLDAVVQQRLTDPLAVAIFILLAIPLGLQVEQTRSIGLPALYGIATVAVFFMLRNTGSALSAEGVLPAAVFPWALVSVFSAFGAWRFHRLPG